MEIMEESKMKGYKYYGRRKFAFVLIGIVVAIAVGFVIMLLWNWLMPELFGLVTINFWQAVGLLILSKILFGGGWFRKRHGGPSHWQRRKQFMKKWENMCVEDRDKIKEHFKTHPQKEEE